MLQILTCFLNQMVSPEPLMAVQTFSHRVLEVLNMTRCFQDGFWHQIRGIHFCEIISSDKGIFPHPCNLFSKLHPRFPRTKSPAEPPYGSYAGQKNPLLFASSITSS